MDWRRQEHYDLTAILQAHLRTLAAVVGAAGVEVGLPDADGAVLGAAGVGGAARREAHTVHRPVMPCSMMRERFGVLQTSELSYH